MGRKTCARHKAKQVTSVTEARYILRAIAPVARRQVHRGRVDWPLASLNVPHWITEYQDIDDLGLQVGVKVHTYGIVSIEGEVN